MHGFGIESNIFLHCKPLLFCSTHSVPMKTGFSVWRLSVAQNILILHQRLGFQQELTWMEWMPVERLVKFQVVFVLPVMYNMYYYDISKRLCLLKICNKYKGSMVWGNRQTPLDRMIYTV